MAIAIRKGRRSVTGDERSPVTQVPSPLPEEPEEPLEDETAAPAGYLGNTLGVLAPLAIGVGGLVLSVQLGLGSFTAPGPGLWPALICAGLTAMSVVLLLGGRRFHNAELLTRSSLLVLVALATLIALVAAMPYIGFEIPTLLVAFVWLTVLGRERWLLSAVLAVVITVVLWLLFIQLFDVPLPHLI
jgi:putative tricarboxylic transport membrane protein